MTFYIETERLILRDIQPNDADGIFELDSNPIVHKYLGNNPIHALDEAKSIIKFIIEQYYRRGIGRFAAIEKSTGNFIGWSGLKFNTGDKEALGEKRDFYDIGYRLIPKYWGHGYATESALAVLEFGFEKLKLPIIHGAAEIGNIASNRVLEKIGLHYTERFPYDGEMVNWYELNRDDYGKKVP